MAKKVSKFVRIAVEGATTDGRVIEKSWIEDMAATYDPKVYGARVNLEHIKGYMPDSPFRRYGDVVALKTEDFKVFGETKLALLAQISCDEDLVEMVTVNNQKIYHSVEVDPKFAETGKAYLVGLAATDEPASLGTEMLNFASKATVNPFASRKLNEATLFSEAIEAVYEFEASVENAPNEDSLVAKFVAAVKELTKPPKVEASEVATQGAEVNHQFATELATELGKQVHSLFAEQNKTIDTLTSNLEKTTKDLTDFKTKVDDTEAGGQGRGEATGGNASDEKTDC